MRRASFALALLPLLLASCSGDHDQLAARPKPSSDAGPILEDASAPADDADADASDPDNEPPPDASDENPLLPFVLTVVHGMPDAPAIRLCFVPVLSGEEKPLAEPPLPSKPQGLAYGARMVVEALSGIELPTTSLRPYVLSGDLGKAADAHCAELFDSEREGLVLSPLPLLPAGTFAEGRSALLVTTGCVGGADHVVPGQDLVCGDDYGPDAPTAGMVLVGMSAKSSGDKVGLQAVHAFATSSAVTVEVSPGDGFSPWLVTPHLSKGAIAPQPTPAFHAESSLAALPNEARILFKDAQSSAELGAIPLATALENGGLNQADFKEGRSFTLIGIGPQPNVGAGAWWKAFTVVAVANRPGGI